MLCHSIPPKAMIRPVLFLAFSIGLHAGSQAADARAPINDVGTFVIAEAEIAGHLQAIQGSVYVRKKSPCEFETLQDTPGELAMHQEIVLNFSQLDFIKTGKTVGPGRDDAVQRKIAEKNPFAVFYGRKAGGKVATIKTWFDPNPYKLSASIVEENEFVFFTKTEADREQLKKMIVIFSDQCLITPR
jgi:hypothetical protein